MHDPKIVRILIYTLGGLESAVIKTRHPPNRLGEPPKYWNMGRH